MPQFVLPFMGTASPYNGDLLTPVQDVDESLPFYFRHEEFKMMEKKF